MTIPSLRAENIVKHRTSGFTLEVARLELRSGKIYSVVGPNGAGKTTLLNILNLLEEPAAGKIFFRGERVTRSNSLNIRRRMGTVMEDPYLFHTTVYKNITAGLMCHSIDKKAHKSLAEDALRMVGLDRFYERYAPELSRGESQRVAIARALAFSPDLLFLDEPFTNIDRKNIAILEQLIKEINQKHQTTIIFTTHDLGQANRLADEVISLVDGRLANGSLENLFLGDVIEGNGLQFIRISPKVLIAAITESRGMVHINIPPQDIILYSEPLDVSAPNRFEGIIEKIQMEGQIVRVFIRVNKEVEFVSIITRASYEKMNLFIDSNVFLTFKTTSVTVF